MKTAKAVVITGAAGGIGTAMCEKFTSEGYAVWAVDWNEAHLASLKEKFEKTGGDFFTRKVDVTDEAAVRKLIAEVQEKSHGLHVWVNNAGITGVGHFAKSALSDIRRVIDVNLTAVAVGTWLALEAMDKQGEGTIVNIASVAGHVAAPYLTVYSATKHGVVGLTRSLEVELQNRQSPIRTVLVCPGFIDTEMLKADGKEKFAFPEWLRFCLSTPDQVAKEVVGAVKSGRPEIYPSLNGKMILAFNRFVPNFRKRGSKLLIAKSFKDYLLNRFSA